MLSASFVPGTSDVSLPNAATPITKEGSRMEFSQVEVTPEIARQWLESTRINRPIQMPQVKAYARDMRAGKWRPVGDTIRFDRLGNLIDGQHRLTAIVDCGVTLPLLVVTGLEPEDQLVIDGGMKRRAGDQLTLMGQKHATRIASVARGLFAIDSGRVYDSKLRVTNQEIFDTMLAYPGIIDAVHAVEGLHRQIGITALNAGLAYVIGSQKIPVTTYNFFHKLRTGANMASTDPVLLLRNRLTSSFEVGTRLQQLWLTLRAMELAKLRVESYTKLQLPRDSKVDTEAIQAKVKILRSFKDEREES
jgi:hypothetical protein